MPPAAPPSGVPAPGTLLGRQAELHRITELLTRDEPVLVLGEGGVGKTTLLRAAAATQATTGRPVREGGALSTLSYLDYLALERALARPMIAGDVTAVGADVESALGDALLLLDDLHWAATATLDVAAGLAGRVGVLAGVRSGEPGTDHAVEVLLGAGYTLVELDGLTLVESEELVAALRPDLPAQRRRRIAERTGGNPLLLRELASTGEASASLRLSLAARLRRLDATGHEAFGLLALAGRPVSVAALGEPGVKSLLDADLVLVADERVEVRHALLAEVAIEAMPAQQKRELHARIARAVDDPGEAARHYRLAGETADAFAAAMRAVEATTRPGERARHLAVAAACAAGPEADTLRLRAAQALEAAHEWDEMVRALDGIAEGNTTAQAEAHLLRARGAWSAGDVDGLRSSLAAGIALVAGTGSEIETRLLIEQTRVPVFVDEDAVAGLAAAHHGLDLARRQGVDLPRAHYLLGTALAIFDQPGGVEHLDEAIATARELGDTVTEFLAASNLISTHEMSGDPAVGRELAREYMRRAQQSGLGEWERLMRVTLASLDFHTGDYAAVLTAAEELLDEHLDTRAYGQLLELFGVVLVDVGRIDEALRRIDAARPGLVDDTRGRMQELWVRIEAAFWGGRPAEAVPLADEYIELGADDVNLLFGAVTRAWALVDLGRDPGAAVPAQVRPILRPIPAEVDGVRALSAGEHPAAAAHFEQAARLWAGYHLRGELRALWGQAEAVRRDGDTARAVQLLEALEQRVEQHGMASLLARVHRSLRAAGVRRSAPRTRNPGSTLSGRQREVLALVGEGLTNAEIAQRLGISRHTVVSQLSSASAKLGATSRAQAATLAGVR